MKFDIDDFSNDLRLLLAKHDVYFDVRNNIMYLHTTNYDDNIIYSSGGGLNKYTTFEKEECNRPWNKK